MRTLIRGGLLIDGSGGPSREGDLLIEDDRIAEVGETSLAPDEVLDARGLAVAPGFIDMHSHGDFTLPHSPRAEAKLLQGVTTEVVGNCGLGMQPANELVEKLYAQFGRVIFGEGDGGGCSPTLAAYRQRLEEARIAVNVACLIPHGNVRCAAMGMVERTPSEGELGHMREIVAQGMSEGAFGLSSGLVYPPGAFAETEELIELAKVAAAGGGFYATHMRDEGGRLVESVQEALRIGAEAEIPVQISHHKALGRFNWGKVKQTLALLDEARARGQDVHSDVYPYLAGSTVLSAMFLPLWVFEGGDEAFAARLRDPATRKRIERETKQKLLKMVQLPGLLGWVPKRLLLPLILRKLSELVVISSVKRQRKYEGSTLAEVARSRRQRLFDAMLDLLLEEDAAVIAIAHAMCEEDVQTVLKHPASMVGSDGFEMREGKPHPRTYGTFPRVLHRYVRETKLLELEQAVHRMTGLVAQKLGLGDRGVLAPGAAADLVLFDPARVEDRATYEEPRRSPLGMPHVFVNGVWTVKDGAHTDARAGRTLERSGS